MMTSELNYYDIHASKFLESTFNVDMDDLYQSFLRYLADDASILDLGCGPGRDSKIFVKKGYRVIGIDLSEKMIDLARKRVSNAEFKIMDIMDLKFEDNFFDGIWANAFVHISRKEMGKVLVGCKRVLKKNGIFYLSVKQGEGERLLSDERYNGVKKFFSYFSKIEIESYLKKANFEIIKSFVKKPENNYSTHPWIRVFCRKTN